MSAIPPCDSAAINQAMERKVPKTFDRFSGAVTRAVGSPFAFGLASAAVLLWAATGPMFHFSENWQMVINTGTTIVTFLMVFLIQQAQNKDGVAVHLKLNELLASHRDASNRLVSIEDLDENELRTLRAFYGRLAKLAADNGGLKESHSLDEAEALDDMKDAAQQRQRAPSPRAEPTTAETKEHSS
ncbi:MAG: low affinity iron permease family protein [Tahibacter sp.]